MRIIPLLLLCISLRADAAVTWTDIAASLPQPVIIRELHDGNWLAGYSKRLYSAQLNNRSILDLNFFHAWRTNHGDSALGLSLGIPLGTTSAILDNIGMDPAQVWKPWKYLSKAISGDVYGGYRPIHGPDVHSFIYGVGAKLSIPFGDEELQKGL